MVISRLAFINMKKKKSTSAGFVVFILLATAFMNIGLMLITDSENFYSKKETETNEPLQLDKKINVLVLCVGAGTSAMFANAVKEGAKETGLPVDATASAYGNHYDILKNYDVVVLSPQVQAHLEEVKQYILDCYQKYQQNDLKVHGIGLQYYSRKKLTEKLLMIIAINITI